MLVVGFALRCAVGTSICAVAGFVCLVVCCLIWGSVWVACTWLCCCGCFAVVMLL